jgi:hypothetical protein
MSFFSAIIAYSGAYLFLVFIAVCLATGLYYLAEMVEEHTRLTKRVLQWSIKISVGVNVLLLIVDGMPFSCVAVSLAALGCYQTLLKRFPFIEATSPEFIGSALFLVANHVMWLRHFRGDAYEYEHHTLEYHLGFFLMIVWIVPFGFFISLAANESVLPSGGLAGSGGSGILNATGGDRDGIRSRRDERRRDERPGRGVRRSQTRSQAAQEHGVAVDEFRQGAVGEGGEEELPERDAAVGLRRAALRVGRRLRGPDI